MPVLIIIGLILALTGAVLYVSTSETPAPVAETSETESVPTSVFKNGTFTAEGHYVSPAGNETVQISVVLTDDVVTGATFTAETTHNTSQKFQTLFSEGYTTYVVGKKLSDISLTVVNGASLVPKGFMDGLAQVKAQARI